MRFTFRGSYGGREISGEWRDGGLRGDAELLKDAAALVRARADVSIPGIGGGPASLGEWVPAMGIVLKLMPDATFPEVDVPADLPPSAVA